GGSEIAIRSRPPTVCIAATAERVSARSPAFLTMAFQLACINAAERTSVSARLDNSGAEQDLDRFLADGECRAGTSSAGDHHEADIVAGGLAEVGALGR